LRQDAILHQANDAVLRILIKFSWHVPDFPIYSNGTKPGTLHPLVLVLIRDSNGGRGRHIFGRYIRYRCAVVKAFEHRATFIKNAVVWFS
ncbi:hypothetical protein ACOJAZ_13665, partial [Corynebacterium striatum]